MSTDTEVTNYQTVFIVPESAVSYFDRALDPDASALMMGLIEKGPDKGKWKIEAIFEGEPDRQALGTLIAIAAMSAGIPEPEWDLMPIPKKNWLRENLVSFPPITLGRYYIYGSHIETPPPADKISLQIDAATAFGSGEHATTQGCLTAFEELLSTVSPASILDMGCGSGILSMAAAKALEHAVSIDAVDIDPESVRVTTENCVKNGVDDCIRVWQSDGYERVEASYDLVFANILARPLIEMAPALYQHLKPGGYGILSGFLMHQKPWVMKAHAKAGLVFVKTYKVKEWGTLIVKRDQGFSEAHRC